MRNRCLMAIAAGLRCLLNRLNSIITYPSPQELSPRVPHKTVLVWVQTDIDAGIADLVRLLNKRYGIRTHSSCQGVPGSYRAYVMVTWADAGDYSYLKNNFDFEHEAGCTYGYVHGVKIA